MGASYSIYLKPFVAGFVAYATYRWLSGSPAKAETDAEEKVDKNSVADVVDSDKQADDSVPDVVDSDKQADDSVPDVVVVNDDKQADDSVPDVVVDGDKQADKSVSAVVADENQVEVSPVVAVSPSPMIPPIIDTPSLDEEPKPVVELKETPKELDAAEKQEKAVRALILPSTGRAVEEIPMTDTVTSTRSWIYDTPWAPTEPLTGDRAVLFADDVGVEPAHHMGPSLYGAPFSATRRDVYR